jgi:modification target Cys-rich repeat protein
MKQNFFNLSDLLKAKENLTLALSLPISAYKVFDEFQIGCTWSCKGTCDGSCQGYVKN